MFRLLRDNKSTYAPQTTIPRHGITGPCPRSGLSLDIWNNDPKASGYVSGVANAKIEAAKDARKSMKDIYGTILKKGDAVSMFPVQFEDLGRQKGEESHIAVVHIDGNDMGERFKNLGSLDAVRRLSATVDEATRQTFRELVGHIVEEYRKIMDSLGFDPTSKDERRRYPTDGDAELGIPKKLEELCIK